MSLKDIINTSLKDAISYQDYLTLIDELVEDEKTTGPKQHEDLVYYTKLNNQRTTRLNKTIQVDPETASIVDHLEERYTWLVITESWCGDAAQILPLFNKLAIQNDRIDLKLVLRDEHEDLMNEFLTNGGKSIPKLIMLDENLQVRGTWGPRPKDAQTLYDAWKNDPNKPPYKEFQVDLQKCYLKDRGVSTFREIAEIIKKLELAQV